MKETCESKTCLYCSNSSTKAPVLWASTLALCLSANRAANHILIELIRAHSHSHYLCKAERKYLLATEQLLPNLKYYYRE